MASTHYVFSGDMEDYFYKKDFYITGHWQCYNTGHIYIAFHHCVFSDDMQDQLFEQNYYHTPYI